MYAGVPSATPCEVRLLDALAPEETLTALATPKSVTTATPPEMRTLSGLTSRWITPRAWAYASADTTSRRIRTVSAIGNSPSRSTRVRSDSPLTNGMMK
jgi:hypothetical protein